MDDLINIACKKALKKLKGKPEKKDKDIKKKCNYNEKSCSFQAVTKAWSNKVFCKVNLTDCNMTKLKEIEEEDLEDSPEMDPKLLLSPKVYTTKLDHMGLFKDNSFHFVDSKKIIDLIYIKSNPLRKNIVTSDKKIHVVSVMIENSDDDDNFNDNHCDDDDIEIIEYNISEAERVLLSSNTIKKPQIHNFNHLLKNPDFKKSLNELNKDVNALVKEEVYSDDGETGIQRKHKNKNDSKIHPFTSKVPSIKSLPETIDYTMHSDTTSRNHCPKSNENTGKPERNRAVNLPNISEVRRLNQQLLTAEVPPVQTPGPRISISKPSNISYSKIAPQIGRPPPLITLKSSNVTCAVSKKNSPSNNVIVNDNTDCSDVESDEVQVVECTCTKQLVRTANGNLIIKTTKCSLHENVDTKNTNENRTSKTSNVRGNNLELGTGKKFRVTSGSTPQSSIGTPQNIILPSDVQLLLLPTGEMVYVVGSNAGIQLSGVIDNTANEPYSKILKSNIQNRYICAVVDVNSIQLNLEAAINDGVNETLIAIPLESLTKNATNEKDTTKNATNEKDTTKNATNEKDTTKNATNEKDTTKNATNEKDTTKNATNEKRLCISLVDVQSSQLESDNEILDTPHGLHMNVDQPTPRLQSVAGDTEINGIIESVKSTDKLHEARRIEMKMSTGHLVPYNSIKLYSSPNATPKPMTIDLTDDDGKSTENSRKIPNSPLKTVVEKPTKSFTESRSLDIANRNKVPDILTYDFGNSAAKQNKIVGNIVAKRQSGVEGDMGKDQEQLNKSNNAVKKFKVTADKVGLSCIKIVPKSNIKTRKRNAVSAKLSNAESLNKRIMLRKPSVTKLKLGADSIIMKTIEDELKTTIEKESASDSEDETNTEEISSDWVLEGI